MVNAKTNLKNKKEVYACSRKRFPFSNESIGLNAETPKAAFDLMFMIIFHFFLYRFLLYGAVVNDVVSKTGQ